MSSDKFENLIVSFAHRLEEENNNAFDLWSWLPSHKAAELAHGDYASNFQPSTADIIREAAIVISELKGYDHTDAERSEWFACPCGECKGPQSCRGCDLYADQLGRCRAVEDAPGCPDGRPHERCPYMRKNGGYLLTGIPKRS